MKEVFLFLKWQWKRWQLWQKIYLAAMSSFLIAVLLPAPYGKYALLIPVTVVFVSVGKWWIWDMMKESWLKYKSEKKQLLDVIKGD
jgi:hypothetical protein